MGDMGDSYIYYPCFLHDTKILCLNEHFRDEYLPIQNLRKGTFVKTVNYGYVQIDMIGTSKIYQFATKKRIKDQLYVCSKEKYPELLEDLVITGGHSILVDEFREGEREKTIEVLGKIYATDNYYRLPACVDDRTTVYENIGYHSIYHIALEHENYLMNYGVFANGLLVETCSRRYLKEHSNMELLG